MSGVAGGRRIQKGSRRGKEGGARLQPPAARGLHLPARGVARGQPRPRRPPKVSEPLPKGNQRRGEATGGRASGTAGANTVGGFWIWRCTLSS